MALDWENLLCGIFNGSPKDWFTIGEHSDCLSSSIMFRFSQTESKLYPLFKQGEIFLSVLLDDNDRYWNTYRFVFSRFLREHTSLRERFCELIIARRDAWARSDFLGCHLVDADDDVTLRAAVVVAVAGVVDVGDKEMCKCTQLTKWTDENVHAFKMVGKKNFAGVGTEPATSPSLECLADRCATYYDKVETDPLSEEFWIDLTRTQNPCDE